MVLCKIALKMWNDASHFEETCLQQSNSSSSSNRDRSAYRIESDCKCVSRVKFNRVRFGWWKTGRRIDERVGWLLVSPILVRSILSANIRIEAVGILSINTHMYVLIQTSLTAYILNHTFEIAGTRCVTQYWNQLCCRLKICLYSRKRAYSFLTHSR